MLWKMLYNKYVPKNVNVMNERGFQALKLGINQIILICFDKTECLLQKCFLNMEVSYMFQEITDNISMFLILPEIA
jgi:hypothetical protein